VASHDLTTEIFYSSAWHDVSTSVRTANEVHITRGVRNPGDEATPASLTLTFDGRDGELNPRNAGSSLFGLIGQNTPIRVTLGASVRFYGEIKKYVPQKTVDWQGPGSLRGDAWIDITAAGILARLSRGVDTAKSALLRSTLPMDPVAYWALEDGADATYGASALNDGNSLQVFGTAPTWADDNTGFPGSLPGPKVIDNLTVIGDVFHGKVPNLSGSECTISFWFKGTSDDTNAAHVWAVDAVRLSPPPLGLANPDAYVRVACYHDPIDGSFGAFLQFDGSSYASYLDATESFDGNWHNVVVQMYQNGAGHIQCDLWWDGIQGTGTDAHSPAYTMLPFTDVIVVGEDDLVWGPVSFWIDHVAILDSVAMDPADIYRAGRGWDGEFVEERFTRLCDEAGITSDVVGTVTYTHRMGPQYPSTLLGLFSEIERTDDGQIYDARTFLGLELRTGGSLLRQDPALTLDYGAEQIAPTLQPVVGDEHIRNDVTAVNPNRTSGRFVQESGPLNVQAPGTAVGAAGRYDTTMDVNFQDSALLRQAAAWRVAKGTYDDAWYLTATADLDSAPTIAGDVDTVDIGAMVELDNLAPDEVSTGTVRHLVIGYDEVIGPRRRMVTFNQQPAPPFEAGILGTTSQAGYLDCGACTTNEALDTTETGVDVLIGDVCTWTHASGNYDIMIGGERMTVTAVSAVGGSLGAFTQTLTVTRSVNGVVKSHASGAAVHVADGFILAL
jgi:hypothetical protein